MKYPVLIFPDGPKTPEQLLEEGTYYTWVPYYPFFGAQEVIKKMDHVDMLRGIEHATGITYNFSDKPNPKFMLNHDDGSIDLEPGQVVEYLGTCIAECARRAKELAELRDALGEWMASNGDNDED